MNQIQLNSEQEIAKKHIDGPLLIIAGAGSGKTATLTARVWYMIEEQGIVPSNIMMVTFTNKAATEMRERVAKMLWVDTPRNLFSNSNFPTIGTFHSIWIMILKQSLKSPLLNSPLSWEGEGLGVRSDFVIYDESDKTSVLKGIVKNDLHLDEKQYKPRQIWAYISNAKSKLITPIGYEREVDSELKEIVHQVYTKYEQRLQQNNAIDFDDILIKTYQILKQYPDILDAYQNKYQYIMVDEYQDTNKPQYEIISLLASKYNNLAVVWDDSQCLVWDTNINIPEWKKQIKDIKIWDLVQSYDGGVNPKYYPVTDIYKNSKQGELYTITTQSWKQIQSTGEHIFFCNPEENFIHWYEYGVYLMYKHKIGYRIWFTRFKWLTKNTKKNIYGLRKRLNWEQADYAWILATTNNKKQAKYLEQYYSYKYWIPQTIFSAKWKLTELDQNDINSIFKNINTLENARALLSDLNISKNYPHIIAQASNRNKTLRVNINFLMMWWNENNRRFWMYRVTVHSSHKRVIKILKTHFPQLCRSAKFWIRIDKELADYKKIWELTQKIYQLLSENGINTQIIQRLSYTDSSYLFMPAQNLQPWFWITVWDKKSQTYISEPIIKVTSKKEKIDVYDINIKRTHNFVANNFIVHNSIYSWRGADMTNIINFKKDYPDALIVKLEQNYRSTQSIIWAANEVIKNNKFGMQKNLWTNNEQGSDIVYIEAPDDKIEARIISEIILDSWESYSDQLVLYRTNAQSRKIEESLMSKNIPYRIIGGLKFYDRKEIKDLLAYLKIIYNPQDIVSMKRIINTPTRKIGAKSIEILDTYRENFGIDYMQIISNISEIEELKSGAKKSLSIFGKLINNYIDLSKKISVYDLLNHVIKDTEYIAYITDGLPQEEQDAKKENIDELVNLTSEYMGMDPRDSLGIFLEEIALLTDMDTKDERSEYVTLMTIHTSKWLEQQNVFLTGLEDNVFPSFRSIHESNLLEEERRLMYVAMTRARKQLYISRASTRFHFGEYINNPESRFISEIPSKYITRYDLGGSVLWKSDFFSSNSKLECNSLKSDHQAKMVRKVTNNNVGDFSVWDRVEHIRFGTGSITSLTWEIADIKFASGNKPKKMNIKIAPIQKL